MKNILLIATGGTIACSETTQGLAPAINAQQILSYIPEVSSICTLTGVSIMNVDSTNMTPARMKKIAKTIGERYDIYDGFVITHGTDTMAYSSAALSYMLTNLQKPVIFTGSQIALEAPDTDAKSNLYEAIRFACEDIRGVFISFHGLLIEGTHAMKVKTKGLDAFHSINLPVIAAMENNVVVYHSAAEEASAHHKTLDSRPFCVATNLCENIFILKLFPALDSRIFDFIKAHYKGVIIESYGIGGIPDEHAGQSLCFNLVSKVHELIDAGIAVVITTQCLYEGVNLDIYSVGKALAQSQIIVAPALPTEALSMKLMWALGNFRNLKDVKKYMET